MNNHNINVSIHYLGDRGKRYSQGASIRYLGHKLQAEFFQPFIQPDHVVLDFGCGKGGIASYIKCSQIDGMDANPYQLEKAKPYLQRAFSEYQDIPSYFYDVVYSNHALEHVPSPILVLQNIRKWLKPGGITVFIVPHDCIADSKQTRWEVDDFANHLYTWTPRSLANLFKEAGFQVQKSVILKSAWHPKLFWLHNKPLVGKLSRRLLSWFLHSRQVLCVAKTPS